MDIPRHMTLHTALYTCAHLQVYASVGAAESLTIAPGSFNDTEVVSMLLQWLSQ